MRLCTITLLFIHSLFLNAQQSFTPTDSVMAYMFNAMQFNKVMPQEKVYLHFDNTGYFMGEKMWFKAYVTRTDKGVRSDMSKVLYVELVNPSGDVVKTRKLHVVDGEAHGDFTLDSILGSGFYEVRAFTRYMTNWGGAGIFSRVFPIFTKPAAEGDYSSPTISKVGYRQRMPNTRGQEDSLHAEAAADGLYTSDVSNKINVRFFPEGGSLVKGMRSRVAFAVTDGNGSPFDTYGELVIREDSMVRNVYTTGEGRGMFEYSPEDGDGAALRLYDQKGKARTFTLPAPQEQGCVMTADAVRGDEISVTVRPSGGMQGRLLGYMVMNAGNALRCDTVTATEEGFTVRLPRRLMPAGVSQMTVFDSSGRIQCERLFFIRPENTVRDSIAIVRGDSCPQTLSPCCRVKLEVRTPGPHCSFSFSAMDAATMTGGKEGNALTWNMLASEVKGYVRDIGYYFEADDTEHRERADMLMMTQGWRRYDWRMMAGAEKVLMNQPVEDRLYLFGRLKPYRKRNTVDNVRMKVHLYNSKGQSLSGTTVTDSTGYYAFELPDMSGEWMMQIFTLKQNRKEEEVRKTYRVGIDRRFSPAARYITPQEASRVERNTPNLFAKDTRTEGSADDGTGDMDVNRIVRLGNREMLIPTVKVKARKRYFTNDENVRWQDETRGWKWASIYYDCDEETDRILDAGEELPTVYEFLAKRNPNFNNPEAEGLPTFRDSCDAGTMTYRGKDIQWFVDNHLSAITSYKILVSTPTCESSVKYVSETFPMPLYLDEVKSIFIMDGFSDRNMDTNDVNIYLYTHPTVSTESNKGLRRTYFQGYNVPSTFEMEDYTDLPPMEDFRRTIFWEPNVKTDKDGKAKIEFFNNSSCTQMYISAEGMTKEGRFIVNE